MTTPKCPICGAPLTAVALGPDTPPWVCEACSRGYWQSELDAADSFDPEARDFGHRNPLVQKQVTTEHAAAMVRQTSARPDTLSALDIASLDALAGMTEILPAAFASQVRAEITRRKKT